MNPDHYYTPQCGVCDHDRDYVPDKKAKTMNPEQQRTTIIDPTTGEVITLVPVYATVGPPAFHAAEMVGHKFIDGRVYLTVPVSRTGQPISTKSVLTWRYLAPSLSSASRVEL